MDDTAVETTSSCATASDTTLIEAPEASKLASSNIFTENVQEEFENEFSSNYCWSSCTDEYNVNMCDEFGALEMDEKPSASHSTQCPGIQKQLNRVNGTNGLITKGVDLRHLPDWIDQKTYFEKKFILPSVYFNEKRNCYQNEPKALNLGLKERQDLIRKDPFGLDTFNVEYSLGKRKRWELEECFEETPELFQHPYHNVTSVLMSSNQMPEASQLYAEHFPALIEGVKQPHRVKILVGADAKGEVYRKETKGRALPSQLLKPVESLPGPTRKQPKHKQAARKFRRREMLRKRDQCQNDPLRLTYFINQPRPTAKQLTSESMINKFNDALNGKKSQKVHKNRASSIPIENYETYDEDELFDDYDSYEVESLDDDYCSNHRKEFSLADFVVEQEQENEECSSYELYSSSSSKFEFVQRNQRKSSIGNSSVESYELVNEVLVE